MLVLLTLREMVRQRRASYQPLLIVAPPPYFDLGWLGKDPKGPEIRISAYDAPQPLLGSVRPTLRLFNVGVGAAANVSVTWRLDAERLAAILRARDSSNEVTLKMEGPRYTAGGAGVTLVSMALEHDLTFTREYALPAHVSTDPLVVPIPWIYLQFLALLGQLCAQRDEGEAWGRLPELPAIPVTVGYEDIGGEVHLRHYSIEPSLLLIRGSRRGEWEFCVTIKCAPTRNP